MPVATPPATLARVIFGTDAATPLAALPAIPLKPLAANPSAAPANADSAATDAPPVTVPHATEVAKLTTSFPKTSLYGYGSTFNGGLSGIGTGLRGFFGFIGSGFG